MNYYYVNRNAQLNGDHEVHTTGCAYLPNPANRIYLGMFFSCHQAVEKARDHYR